MTAVVSMYNVKAFLENGTYIFPQQIYESSQSRETRAVIHSLDRAASVSVGGEKIRKGGACSVHGLREIAAQR